MVQCMSKTGSKRRWLLAATLSCGLIGGAAVAEPGPIVTRTDRSGAISAARTAAMFSAAGLPTDPAEILRLAQQRCEAGVRDYKCVFTKRERIGGKLKDEEAMSVLYRNDPRSVYMTWIRNPQRAKRCVYVRGRNVGKHGEEQALVEPAGAIARLFVSQVNVPIHGDDARAASRYPIDCFGFHTTLARLNADNERFAEDGAVQWQFEGSGTVDGRPTWVLARLLPYTGPEGRYPDARLVVHLDQEWLLPVAIYSYGDRQERKLLGSYVSTQVQLNPGLGDLAFAF